MFAALFAGALIGAFIAGTIIIIKITLLSISYLKKMVKEKLKNKNRNKLMIAETKDLFKEKMTQSSSISMDELDRMSDEAPIVSAVYDYESDEIMDIEGIKSEQMEGKLKSVMKQNDGFLVLEE